MAFNGYRFGIPDAQSVSFFQAVPVYGNASFYNKNKKTGICWVEMVLQLLAFIKITQGKFCVLIDPAMFSSLFTGYNGGQLVFPAFLRKMPLLIPRYDILNFWKYP